MKAKAGAKKKAKAGSKAKPATAGAARGGGAVPLGAGAVGYSTRTLLEKLGIKPGARLRLEGTPDGYLALLGPLPPGARAVAAGSAFDFAHVFVSRHAALEPVLKRLRARLDPDGMIWVSWPKKASGVATDVSEGEVRRAALGNGLVDVKVAAVTDVWSGLKLVIPLKDRKR